MYLKAIEQGGLAVVTGGANGVGFAAAERFAKQGLSVMLADVSEAQLTQAVEKLKGSLHPNAEVFAVQTDVSDSKSVEHLAEQAFAAGEVAILMNNAGVNLQSNSWGFAENWRQMIEVNLFGILNGVQAFLPRMVEAGRAAAVINTGSKQGITSPPGNPAYNVSKAGVKVLTENLAHDLMSAGVPISAHLFVPGFTYTGMVAAHVDQKPASAWTSEQTVDYLFTHLEAGDFYILCPDNDVTQQRDARRVAWAMGDIIENRPALSRWHPDFAEQFAKFENQS